MKKFYLSVAALRRRFALPALPAPAQTNEITIGISITTTGPGAALGIPERNALEFVPKEIGGVPLKVIVLDDGGDPTTATTNARRFVTESKADIIMGSSIDAADASRSPMSPTRPAFPISACRRSRSRRSGRNGRCRCRSRSRSWARCCTST